MADEEYLASLEIQRRNFEAQFGSLEDAGFEDKSKRAMESVSVSAGAGASAGASASCSDEESDESAEDGEEFTGFADEPEVVRFKETTREYVPPTKAERRLLATGKLERAGALPRGSKSRNGSGQEEDADADADADVRNDVELQRFLEESHILSKYSQSQSGADLTLRSIDGESVIGAERKRILNSRLQKASLANGAGGNKRLEKMPMKMRKGIVRSRMGKVARYESDARENGIVLSKVAKGEMREIGKSSSGIVKVDKDKGNGNGKSRRRKRDRGLQIQSVGRSTKNGLFISAKEIARVNGTRRR